MSTIAQDVTEYIQRQRQTEQAQRRLADAQASARLGSFEIDLTTGDVTRSSELWRILGFGPDTLTGVDFDHIHADDRSMVREAYEAAVAGDRDVSCTHRIVRPDGVVRWVLSRTSPTQASEPALLAGTMLDITERHEAELALAHLANHDPLTGLANRRLLVEELDRSLTRCASSGGSTGAMYIDLDDFKAVNDRFGHLDGDEVLRAVGARIASVVEPNDTVARLSGDEFLVCCDDVRGTADLMGRAASIQAALVEPLPAPHEMTVISASIGVAQSAPELGADALLRNADAAMYAAKEAGGARSAMFDDSLYAEVKRRQRITSDIGPALQDGQITTHFQPVVALSTGVLTGFEALARWEHPDLGTLSPLEFIDLAERSGAIGALGRRVLADACAALATWNERSPALRLSVAINVSPLQLADQAFPDDVRRAIAVAGIRSECVCLEVTESALMDSDLAVEALRRLKMIGVTIAIDDFGTGYSSLSRLKHFPVDLLKIDQSFVTGVGADPEDEVIVATVINLARSLGLGVVAEGIETRSQLDLLAQFGCQRGQGYLWSAALPLADATAYAADQPFRRPRSKPSDQPKAPVGTPL